MAKFYRDIDFRLEENQRTQDINALEDEDAVKVSVINLVLTAKGEKLFQLEKGTNIRKLLFTPLNQAILFRLERQIRFALENFEPRIKDIRVQVFFYAEQHLLAAKIYFRIIGSAQIIGIDLPLQTLR
jgi:phage baseplate assembly protein W